MLSNNFSFLVVITVNRYSVREYFFLSVSTEVKAFIVVFLRRASRSL